LVEVTLEVTVLVHLPHRRRACRRAWNDERKLRNGALLETSGRIARDHPGYVGDTVLDELELLGGVSAKRPAGKHLDRELALRRCRDVLGPRRQDLFRHVGDGRLKA